MHGYYEDKLAAERLRTVYDLAPPRTRAYLEAEIEFVLERVAPGTSALELGCGYGRVLARLADRARFAVGIDTSIPSLRMARTYAGGAGSVALVAMDAASMAFADRSFDVTVCIQNGVSAFHVDRERLFAEAVRVTRSGGAVLFSSYAESFWNDRMEWFEIQAAHGLIGPIDHGATGNGVIVCTDGFRATTVSADEFRALAARVGLTPSITEVGRSSLFCEVIAP
jgi:SAM-dependent methyltransferase